MRTLLYALTLLSAAAQQDISEQLPGDGPDLTDADPDFTTFPDDGIDYPGCFKDLVEADRNGDGVVKSNEYLNFIQTYGKRICHVTDRLSLEQRAAFNALACRCQTREGYAQNCCLGSNAQIETAGALDALRTQDQKFYLTAVCRVTDGTIYEPRGCPPFVISPDDPPPFIFSLPPPPPVAPSDGLSPGAIVGIVLGILALLLLLCCCCCVWRKKKRREAEEEELEEKVVEQKDLEQAPEQPPPDEMEAMERGQPANVDPAAALGALGPAAAAAARAKNPEDEEEEDIEKVRGSAMIEDEEEDEEVRKKSGWAKIDEEDDPNRRRLHGEGEIPHDPAHNPVVILKPIPDKEMEEDPDWDHPGRDINFPKDKDEMSAGEVEHYEPDGGVYFPEREGKEALDWRKDWERPEVEDPDENDNRKHRIQAGLGEGEVWDKLNTAEEPEAKKASGDNVFDWVVQSALGVLDKSDQAGHLEDGKNA